MEVKPRQVSQSTSENARPTSLLVAARGSLQQPRQHGTAGISDVKSLECGPAMAALSTAEGLPMLC